MKSLVPFEVFTANIEAGNNTQLMIRDLIESYGLTIGKARGHGVVCAISTVEAIYNKYGYHTLSRTLRLIIGAWEGDPNSLSANMLNAVAKLVVVYGDALNDEVFKDKVGAVSLKQLIRVAKDRRNGSSGYAEAMLLEYNGKKKGGNRLGLNKLYARNNILFTDYDEDAEDDSQQFFDDFEEDDLMDHPSTSISP